MALLKSTVVKGSLRVTDSVLADTGQFRIIEAPTASNDSTFDKGSNDEILRSNGSSVYWDTDVKSIKITTASPLSGGSDTVKTGATTYAIGFTNQTHNTVLAGPKTGTTAAPTFRALEAADISGIPVTTHSTAMNVVGVVSGTTNIGALKYNTNVTITNGAISASSYNGLTITTQATGFKLAGGTTSKTLTVPETYTLDAACAYAVLNNTAATSFTGSTKLVTENSVYHALPKINNAHNYTSSTNIYAPTSGGTAGLFLKSTGSTNTPSWINPPIWYGTCSVADVTKTVTCNDFTLSDGVAILVYFTATNTGAVGSITLNVNNTGAFPIKYLYNANDPANIPDKGYLRAGNTYLFHYYHVDNTQYWVVRLHYNSDSTGTLVRDYGGNVPIVTTNANLYRYKILLSLIDTTNYGWKIVPANTTNATDLSLTALNTGKTDIYTGVFNPFGDIYYYNSTTTVATGNTVRADTVWKTYPLDLRYSFNCSNTLTASKDVYLVAYLTDSCAAKLRNPGAMDDNAKATATGANAGPITLTLPTSADGYIYIKLGKAYNTTNIDLSIDHPIYYHDGVAIRRLSQSASYGTTLPANGREGQIFYQVSDPWYELPAGGSTGQSLIKASTNNYDVQWASIGGNTPITNTRYYISGSRLLTTNYDASLFDTNVYVENSKIILNTSWNDYAEYRKCETLTPGACVIENDNGYLTISSTRLIPGASIVSDTYGMCIGEKGNERIPVAISGRVLAHTFLPKRMYHAGMAVCSAPGGTIDIMTREEIQKYPDAIIGIVSEIPDYEEWGELHIKVNGRIWIKIK